MFCGKCGAQLAGNVRFCVKCGAPVDSGPVPARAPGGQGPARQPASPYGHGAPAPRPPKPPAKKQTGLKITAALLAVSLFVGIGVNIFQLIAGTHALSGRFASVSPYKHPDGGSVIHTQQWGSVPVNQIIVVFDDTVTKKAAAGIIGEIGGAVVGELELINLYQLEIQCTTEAELEAVMDAARAMAGVETVFPNVQVYGKDIAGTPCSPLKDPVFSDPVNAAHYRSIGMENAWRIIKGSGIPLNKVSVGVLDTSVYTGSDEFKGKVKLTGDQTDQPNTNASGQLKNSGLNHGTMVTHVIGADPDNNGMVGIAGILEDKLSIRVKNLYDGRKDTLASPDESDITQGTLHADGVDYTYTMKALVYLKEQVDSGATVINCSYGPGYPRESNQWISKAYEKFFKEIQKTHPHVVFVAAAGNEGRDVESKGALNGTNYFPGGMKLPNVITVGAVNNDGTRAEFSNYAATADAEVTLSAPGVNMVLGVDANGQPVKASGTSFSAPQVTAAIALIQSINPGMGAGQVKDLLVSTAAPGVTTDGQTLPIPPGMGSGILRVDEAVLRAINDVRYKQNLSPFTLEELLDMSAVTLSAQAGFREFTVTAHIPAAMTNRADLKIEIQGAHSLDGQPVQSVSVGEEARWDIVLEDDTATVRVVRLDNGGCAFMTLKVYETVAGIYEVTGAWNGSILDDDGPQPLTDWQVRVDQDGTDMKITFLNNSGTVLSGTYDEAKGVFTGRDLGVADDPLATTWWMQENTTVVFDLSAITMTATGSLHWDWAEATENHLFDWVKVDFYMVKTAELP